MSFQFSQHVVGVWFVSWGNRHRSRRQGDLFAIVQRRLLDAEGTADRPYELLYRFRWYSLSDPGNDPFSDKDEKSQWHATFVDKQAALKAVRLLIGEVRQGGDIGTDDHFWVNGNAEAAIEKMASRPWAHVRAAEPVEVN